jgi:hypothetical protein
MERLDALRSFRRELERRVAFLAERFSDPPGHAVYGRAIPVGDAP